MHYRVYLGFLLFFFFFFFFFLFFSLFLFFLSLFFAIKVYVQTWPVVTCEDAKLYLFFLSDRSPTHA